jgi:hypothetical protein
MSITLSLLLSLKLFGLSGFPSIVPGVAFACTYLRHRSLQHGRFIERAVILSDGDTFSVDESWLKQEAPHVASPTVALGGARLSQEKEMIEAALAESRGRISGQRARQPN